jgi:SAM-dependent methyltransferase
MSGSVKEFYETYWSKGDPPPTRDPLSPARAAVLWSLLEPATDRALRLLECGSGEGHLVAEATARGIEAEGMEISGSAVERARRAHPECPFREHSIDDRPWPLPAGSCDVVVAFEVIAHLPWPRELLQGAADVLRPGGHLALTTPYHGPVKRSALAALAFDRHFNVDGEHLRFFSDRALRRLLGESGFTVERIVHLGRHWPIWAVTFVWARRQGPGVLA